MVRGPRRGNATFHSGTAGPSIIEMLEQALTEAAVQYLTLRDADVDEAPLEHRRNRSPRTVEARGRIRGLAISIAMMRHPLRRYETAWWNYVKKLEKKHLVIARESMADGTYTQG